MLVVLVAVGGDEVVEEANVLHQLFPRVDECRLSSVDCRNPPPASPPRVLLSSRSLTRCLPHSLLITPCEALCPKRRAGESEQSRAEQGAGRYVRLQVSQASQHLKWRPLHCTVPGNWSSCASVSINITAVDHRVPVGPCPKL